MGGIQVLWEFRGGQERSAWASTVEKPPRDWKGKRLVRRGWREVISRAGEEDKAIRPEWTAHAGDAGEQAGHWDWAWPLTAQAWSQTGPGPDSAAASCVTLGKPLNA